MQYSHFDKAVVNISEKHPRISMPAYYFLQEALDFASEKAEEESGGSSHVSASELLLRLREYALEQYGPMASTLFEEWNLRCCQDIGDMVFNLIEQGIFAKQESDRREDFKDLYDFNEAFVHPFLPNSKIPVAQVN